jgi:hypothetical protein
MKRKYDDSEERKRRQERSRYIGMVRAVFKVCRRQAVPLYSSKYSRKDFTIWQHIALLALMQRVRKSYREHVQDYLTTTEKLIGALGLSKQAATLHDDREVRPACLFHPPGEGDGWVRQPHPGQEPGVQPRRLRLHPSPRLPPTTTTP